VNGGGRGSYYLPLKATDKIDDTLIGSFMQLLQDNAGDQIKKKIEGNKTSRALPSSSSFFFCDYLLHVLHLPACRFLNGSICPYAAIHGDAGPMCLEASM
jgi:hypothetical protein